MPLFKRRNAVKAKHAKNAPKEVSINEDESSVISEVNCMLNELVNAVSEQVDSAFKNDGHTNPGKKNDTKQTDSYEECSSPVSTNSISEQINFSRGDNKHSDLSLRNNVSEQKDFAEKNRTCESTVQASCASKQTASTEENSECTDTIQAITQKNVDCRDEVQTNSSQEIDMCVNLDRIKSISKPVDSVREKDIVTSSTETTDISNTPTSSQKSNGHENLAAKNSISNQIDLKQTDDEETFSTNNILNQRDSVEENNELTKSDPIDNISNSVKQEKENQHVTQNDSSENGAAENLSIQEKKIPTKKIRSSSENGSEIESQIKFVRRKFGSEAEIMSICANILPQGQQKGINEAVAKYIDNLIKESIFKAVRNIDVNNLCEELVKDASSRKNSESAESENDFIVEQRLNSNSISELVEFQNVENEDQNDSLLPECDGKVSETESLENDTDDIDYASFGGYLADLDDTGSVDDLKSAEEDSLYNSSCSDLEKNFKSESCNSENFTNAEKLETTVKATNDQLSETMTVGEEIVDNKPKVEKSSQQEENACKQEVPAVDENEKPILSDEKNDHTSQISPEENLVDNQEQKHLLNEDPCGNDKTLLSLENVHETDKNISILEISDKMDRKFISTVDSEISLNSLDEENLLMKNNFKTEKNKSDSQVKGGSLPSEEERMKINWRVGNLQVKLPHKSRGKTSLKAWKKRRVIIQPDEFVDDPTNHSLVISVYGAKKHETTFWHSVSSQKAVVFRSSSHTHKYAFTISEGGEALIHLSAENESETQEWMAAIRAVLWPPSPFMELEKMLSGQEFEVSIIDNEFSYHAGLLGMYGYLSITPKKLILLHPQQGYVIQEWYLNTVDKFQFVLQQKADDMHKVLCMTTCKDSSTGQGEILFFCTEAVTLLQALATTIHQVLSYHSKQEGGKYQKELEELAEWMVAPPQDCLNVENDEHYKVPPRQVKSLLDIPNFIFNKSLSPVASAIYPAPNTEVTETLDTTKNKLINTSQDSGISNCTSSDDFLNCSTASFVVGGGPMTGKSSDSELSDTYTPPRTPEIMKKKILSEVVKEEPSVIEE